MDDRLEFPEEPLHRSTAVNVLVLIFLACVISLWGLGGGPRLSDHESIVAQASRQVRLGNGWLIPHINGIPRVRKPPLATWLGAASSLLVDPPTLQPPVSRFSARLPSAIAAILTVLLVWFLGRSMFGQRIGILCGTVMAVSAANVYFSHNVQTEMVLTLFTTGAFVSFWFGTEGLKRRRTAMVMFYICLALAMMAKAPFPLVVVGLPLAVWWFLTIPLARLSDAEEAGNDGGSLTTRIWRQVRRLRTLWLIPGMAVFALLCLPWPIYAYTQVENIGTFWWMEFIGRYAGDMSAQKRDFWYYIPIAFALMFPFCLSMPEAVASPYLQTYRRHRKGLLFALTWVAVQMAFLTTSAFKRPHYLVTAAPALALLLGPTLDRLFLASRSFSRRGLQTTLITLAASIPIGLGLASIFVAREYPRAMGAFVGGSAITIVGVIVCCVAFRMRNRLLSLGVLCLTVMLSFAWVWEALGRSRALQWQAINMVDAFRARSIGPRDKITWCVGRPDARIAFYLGREVQLLFDPFEAAKMRKGRRVVPRMLLEEGAKRIINRLAGDTKEYFVIDAKYWEQLRAEADPKGYEVFRVEGQKKDDTDDDWAVITNSWNVLPPK